MNQISANLCKNPRNIRIRIKTNCSKDDSVASVRDSCHMVEKKLHENAKNSLHCAMFLTTFPRL